MHPRACYSEFLTVCTIILYRYQGSVQDEMDGIMRMHRRVKSEDVEDYSSHIPGDVVALDQEDDIVYKRGVLTHSEGVSTVKVLQQVNNYTLFYCSIFQPVGICCRIRAKAQTIRKGILWRQN